MDFRDIDQLDEQHLEQLVELYKGEWWTQNRDLESTHQAIAASSLVFGIVETSSNQLVAFARVLTDFTFKGFVMDVIVDSQYRGVGLGKRLMDTLVSHPKLVRVRNLDLFCQPEMVPFYENWGFTTDVGNSLLMRRKKTETGNATR